MTDAINNTFTLIDGGKRGHRNKEGLSDLGKQIIEACPNAYINEHGQVIDNCHVYFSELSNPEKW